MDHQRNGGSLTTLMISNGLPLFEFALECSLCLFMLFVFLGFNVSGQTHRPSLGVGCVCMRSIHSGCSTLTTNRHILLLPAFYIILHGLQPLPFFPARSSETMAWWAGLLFRATFRSNDTSEHTRCLDLDLFDLVDLDGSSTEGRLL